MSSLVSHGDHTKAMFYSNHILSSFDSSLSAIDITKTKPFHDKCVHQNKKTHQCDFMTLSPHHTSTS